MGRAGSGLLGTFTGLNRSIIQGYIQRFQNFRYSSLPSRRILPGIDQWSCDQFRMIISSFRNGQVWNSWFWTVVTDSRVSETGQVWHFSRKTGHAKKKSAVQSEKSSCLNKPHWTEKWMTRAKPTGSGVDIVAVFVRLILWSVNLTLVNGAWLLFNKVLKMLSHALTSLRSKCDYFIVHPKKTIRPLSDTVPSWSGSSIGAFVYVGNNAETLKNTITVKINV